MNSVLLVSELSWTKTRPETICTRGLKPRGCPCRNATTASSSKSTPSGVKDAKQRQVPKRPKSQRELIVLRRGSFKNRPEKPPWSETWSFESALFVADDDDLNLHDVVIDRNSERITVDALVEPVGTYGFFVDACVAGVVYAKCCCCGSTYPHALPGISSDSELDVDDSVRFLAFLDPAADSCETSGDYEVFPFPPQTSAVDLTALARDACVSSLAHLELLCARCAAEDEDGNGGGSKRISWSIE
jgi:hypothetical protein